MGELELGRTLLLWLWALGLAGIEIEIEGGYGWAERLPTWFLRRGRVGRVYGVFMGHRPLTGYHVFAFTIPLLVLHLPYVMGEGNKKLSKRDPQASLLHYRDRGYLPEGLLNYLALLAARRWGRDDVAERVVELSRRAAVAAGFAEHWNPETGQGHGAVPITWSALVVALDG